MTKRALWYLAKLLEICGMIVLLLGLLQSISLGLEDEGLGSMASEFQGLAWGGGLFALGWLLERALGAR